MRICSFDGCQQSVEPVREKGAKSERFVNPDSKLATYYFPLVDDPDNSLCYYHSKLAQGLLCPSDVGAREPAAVEWGRARLARMEAHAKLDHDTSATNPKRPTRIERMLAKNKARRANPFDSD